MGTHLVGLPAAGALVRVPVCAAAPLVRVVEDFLKVAEPSVIWPVEVSVPVTERPVEERLIASVVPPLGFHWNAALIESL